MKAIWSLLGVFFLLIGCSEKEVSNFLQEKEANLAPPRVFSSSLIIDSSITVIAELDLEGTEIFYAQDTEPNQKSIRYSTPLRLNEAGTYQFIAFHQDWAPSEITQVKLFEKGYPLSGFSWFTHSNNTYPGIGDSTLFNNQRAALNFRDKQWLGFDTVARAQVYFEKKVFIETISLGYLIDSKSWIFPPESITLILNGTDTLENKGVHLTEGEHLKMADISIPIGFEVDSITIEVSNLGDLPGWHPGKGNKAWLFMDEWIFN